MLDKQFNKLVVGICSLNGSKNKKYSQYIAVNTLMCQKSSQCVGIKILKNLLNNKNCKNCVFFHKVAILIRTSIFFLKFYNLL